MRSLKNSFLKSCSWASLCALVAAVFFSSSFVFAQDKAVMEKGAKVYKEYCQTCHQANGQGLPPVYPPLAKSDYIKNKPKKEIISSVVNGLQGEITVNGKKYNGVMVALPKNYTDEDAAAVLTYVYNTWGNPGGTVTVAEVKAVRGKADPKAKKK
jgi:mono/diheme cytochrome c family protein